MEKTLTASEVVRLMVQSYRRYERGEIGDSKAARENAILANILKAIEVSETEERLKAIENALSLSSLNEKYSDE